MKTGAYTRYYLKHREELIERMRKRDVERKEEKRRLMEIHPELIEYEREKMREKYYRRISSQVKKQIHEWLNDKNITQSFKTFLNDCCLKDDKYKSLTLKTLNQLKELHIASSVVDSLRLVE